LTEQPASTWWCSSCRQGAAVIGCGAVLMGQVQHQGTAACTASLLVFLTLSRRMILTEITAGNRSCTQLCDTQVICDRFGMLIRWLTTSRAAICHPGQHTGGVTARPYPKMERMCSCQEPRLHREHRQAHLSSSAAVTARVVTRNQNLWAAGPVLGATPWRTLWA
jgi:hypothetical protein